MLFYIFRFITILNVLLQCALLNTTLNRVYSLAGFYGSMGSMVCFPFPHTLLKAFTQSHRDTVCLALFSL